MFTYIPKGTCSKRMDVEIEGGIIRSCSILGGCAGNLQGISKLVVGRPATEVIGQLKGIKCPGGGGGVTSCPDQLAKALEECLAANP